MTLQELLEAKKNLLTGEEKAAVLLGELIWTRNGQPTRLKELIPVLELILDECLRLSYRYPPIFLKRKKEMERGVWTPAAKKPIGLTGKSDAERKITRIA